MASAELYEFRVGRVLGLTFSILLKNIVPFGLLALLFAAPTNLYPLFITDPFAASSDAAQIFVGLLDLLLQYIAMAALVYGTVQQLRGRHCSIGDIVGRGLALIFPVLGVAIVETIGIGLGILLLIIPGIFVAIMWYVAVPVAVIERPGVFESLGRSAELTKGNRWKLFALFLILILLIIISTVFLGFIFGYGFTDSVDSGAVIALWLWAGLFYAFTAVLSAVCYYELRAAKEGIDIEELASVFD